MMISDIMEENNVEFNLQSTSQEHTSYSTQNESKTNILIYLFVF